MKSNHSEVLVALTHFMRGTARFSFLTRSNRGSGALERPMDESRRRTLVLQELYRHYSFEISGEDDVSIYRDTLPPDSWVNDRLADRREGWRVQNVDGFRCEIFDVPA